MTPSGRARLFVALDLPAEVREALGWWGREARHAAGPMRLVEVEALHVTLAFLGSRSVDEIEAIAAAMGVGSSEALPVEGLSLGAPLWLPRRRPRVLGVEVHDDEGGLVALRDGVVAALSGAIDWEAERRVFHPHVTVARMRDGEAARGRVLPPTPGVGFVGERATLYRSWLAPSGATYEGLASVG